MSAQLKKMPETTTEFQEVIYAGLHGGPLFVPGSGQFGPTLVIGSGSTISRITRMVLNDNTLAVDIGSVKILVPLANITHMRLK